MATVASTRSAPLDYAVPAPRRRSVSSFLVWTVGIIVFGGMLSAVMLPSLCKSSETANRAKCASNLHQIGLAIQLYAQENAGQYPPSLAVLMKEEQLTPAVVVCPSSNDEASAAADTAGMVAQISAAETNAAEHKHCLSYVYVGSGLTLATASATAVVAYEPLNNHGGDGTNVLFGDGHAEWTNKQAWSKLAAAAGLPVGSSAVVPVLTTQP